MLGSRSWPCFLITCCLLLAACGQPEPTPPATFTPAATLTLGTWEHSLYGWTFTIYQDGTDGKLTLEWYDPGMPQESFPCVALLCPERPPFGGSTTVQELIQSETPNSGLPNWLPWPVESKVGAWRLINCAPEHQGPAPAPSPFVVILSERVAYNVVPCSPELVRDTAFE